MVLSESPTHKMQHASYKTMSFVIIFIITAYAVLNALRTNAHNPQESSVIARGSSGQPIFKALVDSEERAHHLESLNLTPNHSVEMLSTDADGVSKSQVLHGRFLHLTDMHPDELNVIGAAIRKQCHKKVKGIVSNTDISHKYGDAMSGCDAPLDLFNSTLQWIRENLKDHIDFVIWTGDNIRHDNDRSHPRTEAEIFDMNERAVTHMVEAFVDDGEEDVNVFDRRVKIVPSLGNNDVYPHNLFAPGPTLQTRELYKIWRDFIPTEQMHTFDRGAYFLREVIPGKLVVLSINTLYWFQSNPLNDNCDGRKQPGYKLFLWLGAALKECRRRGVKVWLSGHVPPIPKNIHHSCYAKISVWMHEYRDLIIGGVWGHMNIDHWVPLDSVKAWKSIKSRLLKVGALDESDKFPFIDYDQIEEMVGPFDRSGNDNDDDEYDDSIEDYETVEDLYRSYGYDIDDESSNPLHTFSDRYLGAPNGKVTYLETLRDTMYSKLKGKKKSGQHWERYSIAHISSSVIPTYNPGFRIWEYNVTEINSYNQQLHSGQQGDWVEFFQQLEEKLNEEDEIEKLIAEMENSADEMNSSKYTELKAPTRDKTIPTIMPEDLPLGPAYVPQTLSPERYVQYYVDLNEVNYENKDIDSWKFNYKVHYYTDDESKSQGLLVSDWIAYGRELAKSAPDKGKNTKKDLGAQRNSEKLWKTFIDRAFLSSGYQGLPDAVRI